MTIGFDRGVFDAGYSDFDRERFVPETRKQSSSRGEFARDHARVIHSSALRRLGAKTQVLSPSGGDFARTRLTHSLEVAQVGREMALDLGLNPDLVDMACLAHDLGHPPFGHNGEKALNAWAEGIGGFEGNAQTLRLLTRIEQKEVSAEGVSVGLNLTRASLDAACKYPWSLAQATVDTGADHSIKFGVYDDDLPIFDWMRIGAPERRKSVEAQVMDFADDVAYSVHDFEDAIVSGYIDVALLNDKAFEWELIQKISEWNGFSIASDELREALFRLQSEQHWIRSYSASPRDFGQLKNLTSALIGRFVSRTTQAIVDTSPAESLARFGALLVVPASVRAEIAVLKGIVSAFLMSHESRRPFYEWQRAILGELADALFAANGAHLDAYCTQAWASAADEVAQRRVIVDQVACLTDQSALQIHNRLVG